MPLLTLRAKTGRRRSTMHPGTLVLAEPRELPRNQPFPALPSQQRPLKASFSLPFSLIVDRMRPTEVEVVNGRARTRMVVRTAIF
jgi:hypothetical protein